MSVKASNFSKKLVSPHPLPLSSSRAKEKNNTLQLTPSPPLGERVVAGQVGGTLLEEFKIHLLTNLLSRRFCRKLFILSIVFSTWLAGCSGKKEEDVARSIPERPMISEEAYAGRWDVMVKTATEEYPSWFELSKKDGRWQGQFVGRVGSARPIAVVKFSDGQLEFSLPKQYEKRTDDLVFGGKLSGDKIEGTTTSKAGRLLQWTAVRAPSLQRASEPEWGEPVKLFNGKDLTGWKARHVDQPNGWRVEKGVLVNIPPSNDLVTVQQFEDFKLHAEFEIPEGSNSGIYLRGRHELQIEDSFAKEPENHLMGGIYGFLTPSSNPAKKAGEWQSYDITLVGRKVTVVLNGTTVIDNLEIPGITGGALDSHEGTSGPIFLQGDHGKVSYRDIVVTPAKK